MNFIKGMKCPACGQDEEFLIEVTQEVTQVRRVTKDEIGEGTSLSFPVGPHFNSDAYCVCPNDECEHGGPVSEFKVVLPRLIPFVAGFSEGYQDGLQTYKGRVAQQILHRSRGKGTTLVTGIHDLPPLNLDEDVSSLARATWCATVGPYGSDDPEEDRIMREFWGNDMPEKEADLEPEGNS